jgi:hypothetical protein
MASASPPKLDTIACSAAMVLVKICSCALATANKKPLLARHFFYLEKVTFLDDSRVHRDAQSRRGLFCHWCEAPEIHARCRGKIGERRPHCDRLVELLRINLVERVVCGVMVIEIIQSILAHDTTGTPAFCSSQMTICHAGAAKYFATFSDIDPETFWSGFLSFSFKELFCRVSACFKNNSQPLALPNRVLASAIRKECNASGS